VSLVLLIACANVASLMLARDFAGNETQCAGVEAGGIRLVRQGLTGSGAKSGFGGTLGVLIAGLGGPGRLWHFGQGAFRGPKKFSLTGECWPLR
jgi:hypothetical protein